MAVVASVLRHDSFVECRQLLSPNGTYLSPLASSASAVCADDDYDIHFEFYYLWNHDDDNFRCCVIVFVILVNDLISMEWFQYFFIVIIFTLRYSSYVNFSTALDLSIII